MIERGVVMTDLKMFSKPVVFTDFDGVLNAFPDDKLLRRGGVNKVMTWAKPDSPYAKCTILKKRSTWTATKKPTRP